MGDLLVSDKFYTINSTAQHCLSVVDNLISDIDVYIEPSAGNGEFLKLLPIESRFGYDIVPEHNEIKEMNFLSLQHEKELWGKTLSDNILVIGNPPFGKRGSLAVQFINCASIFADTIAFIVPMNFKKYEIHKKIDVRLRLIHSELLPRNSFYLPHNDSEYQINSLFQIWTKRNIGKNVRTYTREPSSHCDFVLWQYNNTKQALKYFENDFDVAIPCQGWQDYNRKETNADNCEKNKQWMLIRANNKQVFNKLMNIDYERLAMTSTTVIPGFRKNDLIEAYVQMV